MLNDPYGSVRCRCRNNRQWHSRIRMSDTGLTVPGMTELPRRYDVTVTVDRDGRRPRGPGRVRRGGRAGGISQSCQHRERTQPARSSASSPSWPQTSPRLPPSPWPSSPTRSSVRSRLPPADRAAVADVVRRVVEPGVPVALRTACPAPHRQVAIPRPCRSASPAGSQMHGIHEIFCGIPGASECPYGHRSGLYAKNGTGIR